MPMDHFTQRSFTTFHAMLIFPVIKELMYKPQELLLNDMHNTYDSYICTVIYNYLYAYIYLHTCACVLIYFFVS